MVMPNEEQPVRKVTLTKHDGTKVQVPVRRINVADLVIDSVYQRDLDNTWVQSHVKEGWIEERSFGIVASARAGRLYVLDGQHRVALARECGGVHQVWAYVREGLSQVEEADLFAQFQRHRRALKVWELFKADTASQKTYALDIARTVHQVGFRVDKNGSPGVITALGSLVSIHKLGGTSLLRDTLTLIRRLWTLDDSMALRGQIMYGIAIFLHSFEHEPQFRMERLEKVLPETAPAKLLRLAQAIASRRSSATVGAANVGEALRDIYNKGLAPAHQLGSLRAGAKRRPAARS